MSWWNDYVGIPYKLSGRDRDGIDCWGLVRLIHKEQFGNDLPSFSDHDHSHEKIREIMAEQRERWISTDSPKIGDVILFRVLGAPSHVGIYIGDKSFIHAKQGINSAIERYDSLLWEKRVIGFYRYDPDSAVLSGIPHPLKTSRINRPIREGMTVAELVEEIRDEYQVPSDLIGKQIIFIDGEIIQEDQWELTFIASGQRIEYRAVPAGDIGSILRLIVIVAAMAVAPYAAAAIGVTGAFGVGLVKVGLMIAGTLLVNAIFPVRMPELGNKNTLDSAKSQLILQGGANQMNLYGSIPVVLGKFRFTPPLAAENYSDLQGSDSYLRMLVCWGYGPLQVSDLRLGDTAITAFEEVNAITLNDYSGDSGDEVKAFNNIYGQDVSQDIVNAELNSDGVDDSSYAVVSNVCTVTYTGHPFVLNQSVTLYITSGNGIGGTYTITSVTANTFTVAMTTANTTGKLSIAAQFLRKAYTLSGNVCTITWPSHFYRVGDNVQLNFVSGGAPNGTYTIDSVTNTTFKVKITASNTSGNVNITNNWVIGSNWNYQVVSGESTQIIVAIHFPQGLRKQQTNGTNTGQYTAALFTGQIQYRQLDSATLAPLTAWGDIGGSFPASTFKLDRAWYNINTDAALEPVYQWTTVAVSPTNEVKLYVGCLTNNYFGDPSGLMLQRLQNETYGFNATFTRLATLDAGDTPLWNIVVSGNQIVTSYDLRSGVTGGGLTISGMGCTLASGSITRAGSNTIEIGDTDQPYNQRKDAFTLTRSFDVPLGKYEVRVRRTNISYDQIQVDGKNYQRYAKAIIYSVTGLANTKPVVAPKDVSLTMTAMRIRATDQLNGNVEGLVGTCQSVCLDWDSATSTWITRPTRNPASLFRYVLQHPANAQKVSDAKINLTDLQAWHSYCVSNVFMFDMVILDKRSLLDVLRDICAAGRASPTFKDGKWSIIIDKPQSTVVQYFTPHNSWGFESSKAIPRLPHAFRVTFNNSERSFQNDEYIVYNDGYSAENATLFEALALPGVTTKNQIFKHARFHFAQLKLRPETYSLNVDMEHLICNRGDLVRVQHDVPQWGLQSGRVKTVVSGTVLILDEAVPMVASTQYTIRFRLNNGSYNTKTVSSVVSDGMYNQITLTSTITGSVNAGDLFMFGTLNSETVQLIVQSIEPMDNLTAKLTLVDYSPDIYNSDDETIPDFNSQITKPPLLQQSVITVTPTIITQTANESTMLVLSPGKYQYRLMVTFDNPLNLPPQLKYVRGQLDYQNDAITNYTQDVIVSSDKKSIIFNDVEVGATYKVRLRYETDAGKFGPWVYGTNVISTGKQSQPSPVTNLAVTAVAR